MNFVKHFKDPMATYSGEELETLISSDTYTRQRLAPQPHDAFYVHLIDILKFLKQSITVEDRDVLDYGCGGSPYRSLFQADRYVRADYINADGIDMKIAENATIECEDGEFSTVLSTQVLEHVRNPQAYLREAWRVLKPGGRIILTTHGIWEDHGCPFDFRRWTADGLRCELIDSGFESPRIMKLTTGPRAIIFMFGQALQSLSVRRREKFGLLFWLLRKSAFGDSIKRNLWMDAAFRSCCMVADDTEGHRTYIALGCIGTKPKDTSSVIV